MSGRLWQSLPFKRCVRMETIMCDACVRLSLEALAFFALFVPLVLTVTFAPTFGKLFGCPGWRDKWLPQGQHIYWGAKIIQRCINIENFLTDVLSPHILFVQLPISLWGTNFGSCRIFLWTLKKAFLVGSPWPCRRGFLRKNNGLRKIFPPLHWPDIFLRGAAWGLTEAPWHRTDPSCWRQQMAGTGR